MPRGRASLTLDATELAAPHGGALRVCRIVGLMALSAATWAGTAGPGKTLPCPPRMMGSAASLPTKPSELVLDSPVPVSYSRALRTCPNPSPSTLQTDGPRVCATCPSPPPPPRIWLPS